MSAIAEALDRVIASLREPGVKTHDVANERERWRVDGSRNLWGHIVVIITLRAEPPPPQTEEEEEEE